MMTHQLISHVLNGPLIGFLAGILTSFLYPNFRIPKTFIRYLTIYILFCIGFKGGNPLAQQLASCVLLFSATLAILIVWGFLQPALSFCLLKKLNLTDSMTAAAISASFGSVSVMTFVTALSFLDLLQIAYQEWVIALLAIMEIPAIISAIFLVKLDSRTILNSSFKWSKIIQESVLNKAIIGILSGLMLGFLFYCHSIISVADPLLWSFKPVLCLFMYEMGIQVGLYKQQSQLLSWPLSLFGIYMPLIGALFGLSLSYALGLDIGTGTLVSVLTASASYIAVPAAMRIAIPQAKEAVYLTLSLGITFPFNITMGIPFYYYLASLSLS